MAILRGERARTGSELHQVVVYRRTESTTRDKNPKAVAGRIQDLTRLLDKPAGVGYERAWIAGDGVSFLFFQRILPCPCCSLRVLPTSARSSPLRPQSSSCFSC